jgi:hypothetical protein
MVRTLYSRLAFKRPCQGRFLLIGPFIVYNSPLQLHIVAYDKQYQGVGDAADKRGLAVLGFLFLVRISFFQIIPVIRRWGFEYKLK